MDKTYEMFIQLLLEEAIRVLLPILVAAMIAWVTYAIKKAQAELGEQRWAAIESALRYAVYAAEQSGLKDKLELDGAQKKQLALQFASEFLMERGISLDLARMDALIEAIVADTLNWEKIRTLQNTSQSGA